MVAGGSKFRSKVELIQKFDQLVAGATNEKKAEFKKRKNEFLSRLNEIDASHQTLVLDATPKGKGMFRGGGSLHVEVEVQIVEVDPFSTGLHHEL